MRITLFWLIFILISSTTVRAQMTPRDRYLNPDFVAGADYSSANKEKNGPRAMKLMKEGITLYKMKKDRAAIAKYEEALELYADPEIYYHYGNSLSNTGELIYSVRAYEYAIEKNYSHPELAWFNMACALSKLRKTDKAYGALKNAVLTGYPSIENVRTDPDLDFIRSDSSWTGKFSELKKLFDRGNTPLAAGKKLDLAVASSHDTYYLCGNGKAVVHYSISEYKNHKKYGTWKFQNYVLTITWTCETGERGVGQPVMCASSCVYKQYKPFADAIKSIETIRWQEVESGSVMPWQVKTLKESCD